jgi:chaperonin GroES
MFELSSHLTINEATLRSANLCSEFTDEDLKKIGQWCAECYERDKKSREVWLQRSEGALELAMQVQKDKTFPWQNCSNIIFPLVTIAAMQFHATAYPVIVSGKDVVKCRSFGEDPEGIEKARAKKVSNHMSWQLLEQDESWEDETDLSLFNVAIVGCGWKKTYYSSERGHNISSYVHAKDLVFDYWAKSIDTAITKTHIIPLFRNEIHSRVRSRQYRDVLQDSWYKADASIPHSAQRSEQDQRDGQNQPTTNHNTPFTMCEQHCWLDLDGDGYAEPYIITFEEASNEVVRIVTRFDRMEDIHYNTSNQIIKIDAWEYFTKVPFIPSPDGSIMDIGFGILLGPLNESVNAAINQLFDAGTLANTAGGFLGRGAKIRGGVYEFAPFSWNRVDSTGDDLRKSIYPLPVREPSSVMFNLLSLIIDYTGRISGATDINVGESVGQNTPAETARTMSEQGRKIYTAIFKRIWRGMKKEFKKLYQLNSVHLPAKVAFGAGGEVIGREDYRGSPGAVVPVADPTVASAAEGYGRAAAVKQLSLGNPAYDADAVELDVLRSLGVSEPERLYKGVANAPEPPPDVKLLIQQMKTQSDMAKLELMKQQMILTLQENRRVNSAKIAELAAKAFKLQEEGESVKAGQQIEAFRASLELMRMEDDQYSKQLASLMEIGKNELEGRGLTGSSGDVPLLEGPSSDTGSVPFAG